MTESALFSLFSERTQRARVWATRALGDWLQSGSQDAGRTALRDLQDIAQEVLQLSEQTRLVFLRLHDTFGAVAPSNPNVFRARLHVLLMLLLSTLRDVIASLQDLGRLEEATVEDLVKQLLTAANDVEALARSVFEHWHEFSTQREQEARRALPQGALEADDVFASVAGLSVEQWQARVEARRKELVSLGPGG